jgi:sortase (surface protein transpeptidase)
VVVGISLSVRSPGTRVDRTVATPKAAPPRANAPKLSPLRADAPKLSLIARKPVRKQMPDPVRISIPSIGVNAPIVPLGLNPDETMEVPTDFSDTGWFQPGPEPGEVGAAIIVGHLNSRSGPAVFQHLNELRVGKVINVFLKDGSRVQYVARSMLRVTKSKFPTKLVYARTKQPTLRLVTCAGMLNPATGHHPDNYIVFAEIIHKA